MKLTVAELLNLDAGLTELSKRELSIKPALAVARIRRKVREELEPVNEERQKLFQKYGEAKGNQIEVPLDHPNRKAFDADMLVLLAVEVELHVDKLKLTDLGERITAAELLALEPILSGMEG